MNKKLISLICAISCSFIWGTAFIAQDMGMDYIGPFSFITGRMFLGFIALVPFFFIFEFKKVIKEPLSLKIIFIYLFFVPIVNIFFESILSEGDESRDHLLLVCYRNDHMIHRLRSNRFKQNVYMRYKKIVQKYHRSKFEFFKKNNYIGSYGRSFFTVIFKLSFRNLAPVKILEEILK